MTTERWALVLVAATAIHSIIEDLKSYGTHDCPKRWVRLGPIHLTDAIAGELSAAIATPQPPKDAGAVPMPERYSFRTNPPLSGYVIQSGDGQW